MINHFATGIFEQFVQAQKKECYLLWATKIGPKITGNHHQSECFLGFLLFYSVGVFPIFPCKEQASNPAMLTLRHINYSMNYWMLGSRVPQHWYNKTQVIQLSTSMTLNMLFLFKSWTNVTWLFSVTAQTDNHHVQTKIFGSFSPNTSQIMGTPYLNYP